MASKSYLFALCVTTFHKMKLNLQFVGLRSQIEHFCEKLKVNLRDNVSDMRSLKKFLSTIFSEYMLAEKREQVPDGGLGQIFKYPGDAKKYTCFVFA